MIFWCFVNSLYLAASCVGRCGKSQSECWGQHGRKHEDPFDCLRHDIGRGRLPCNLELASTLSAACRFHSESLWHARFVLLLVRPSSQHQGSQIGLPRASVVALFLCAGLHLRRFCVECLCVALLATSRLSLDKGLGFQFL